MIVQSTKNENPTHSPAPNMSLSAASSQISTSLTTSYMNAASTSNSNQTSSMSTNSNLRNVNGLLGSDYSSHNNSSSNDIATSSTASNPHHKASQNPSYSTSPLTNDVWMSQMNLPNLTDAILESDIFYPLVRSFYTRIFGKIISIFIFYFNFKQID